jgi:hypothetical protein
VTVEVGSGVKVGRREGVAVISTDIGVSVGATVFVFIGDGADANVLQLLRKISIVN